MNLYADQESGKAEKQRLKETGKGATFNTFPNSGHNDNHKWTSARIELVMFMFLLATKFSEQVITNLLESRECLVSQGQGEANCTEPLSQQVEDLIQPGTATVITTKSLIEASLPALTALLVGPWSDQNGRKPFLTLAIAGYALSFLLWGVLSLTPGLRPAVFLLPSVPIILSGGYNSFLLLCYCYISDVTDEQNRATRLAFIYVVTTVGSTLGSSASPLLISMMDHLNPYPPIFFISAFLLLLTLLYTHYGLRETIVIRPQMEKRFWVFTHIKKLFATCFVRRPNHGRALLLLLIWSLTIVVSTFSGEGTITYLAVREMFSWQLTDYTAYQCFGNIISGVGALIGVTVLVDYLRLSNLAAAALLLYISCVHCVIKALATTGSTLYWALLVNIFFSTFVPFCRTELSQLATNEDLGKVFALTAFHESIIPMFATPVYTLLYKATFLSNPGTIFWLSAGLTLISATMLLIAQILQKSSSKTVSTKDTQR